MLSWGLDTVRRVLGLTPGGAVDDQRSGQPLDLGESTAAARSQPAAAPAGHAAAQGAEEEVCPSLAGRKWTPMMVEAWETEVSESERQQMGLRFDEEGTSTQFMPADRSHHVWKLTGQSMVGGQPSYSFSIKAFRNQWPDEEIYTAAAEVHVEDVGVVAKVSHAGAKHGLYFFCEMDFERKMPSLAGVWRGVFPEAWSGETASEDSARALMRFDRDCKGEGVLGGAKVFLERRGPPPPPPDTEYKWLRMVKTVELEGGEQIPMFTQFLEVVAVEPGLMSLRRQGQAAGRGERMYFALSKLGGEEDLAELPLINSEAAAAAAAEPEAASAEEVALPSLAGKKWTPILLQAWETEAFESERDQMGLKFDEEGSSTQFMPADRSHHVWKMTGQGTVAGKPCYCFSIRAFRNQWSDEELYTWAAEVHLEASPGIVATVHRTGAKDGVYLFSAEDFERALPSLAGVWRGICPEAWSVPLEDGAKAVIHLDSDGKGVGVLGGARVSLQKSGPPPPAAPSAWQQGLGELAKRHLEKDVLKHMFEQAELAKCRWLAMVSTVDVEGGEQVPMSGAFGKQVLQVLAAEPGLLCLVRRGQGPGKGEKMYFALSARGIAGLVDLPPSKAWRCVELRVNEADSGDLPLMKTAKGISLPILGPDVGGKRWWQGVSRRAARDVVIGSNGDRLKAQFALAAAALQEGTDLTEAGVSSLYYSVLDAASVSSRRVGIELLAQLGQLELADPLVKNAAGASGVEMQTGSVVVRVPYPAAAEGKASPARAVERARKALRDLAGGGGNGGEGAELRVCILSDGSRGDVQPVMLLAQLLQAKGCKVKALVRANLVDFCQKKGVDASPVFADLDFMFKHVGGLSNDTLFLLGEAEAEWRRRNPNALVEPMQAMRSFKPGAVVWTSGSGELAARYENAEGVPAIPAVCQGAGCMGFMMGVLSERRPPRPILVPTSKFVEKSPGTKNIHQSGAWVPTEEEATPEQLAKEPLASLAAFLAQGPPPVAVGWGSMLAKGVPAVAMLVRALLAVQEAGQRAVVLGGWAKLDDIGRTIAGGGGAALLKELEEAEAGRPGNRFLGPSVAEVKDVKEALRDEQRLESLQEFARTQCCFISSAPHIWLFAKCRCVVHHGGAGTTHACLYAGKPSILTPIAFDQFHWADTVERLRVGRRVGGPRGLPSVTVGALAAAIRGVSQLEKEAEALGAKMRAEPGVVAAAEALYKFVKEETGNGRWHRLWRAHAGK